MAETQTQAQADATSDRVWQREQARDIAQLARLVLLVSAGTIGSVALIALIGAALNGAVRFSRTTELIFNALLPLLGTWVGTVLAYYFSKQNFESATNSVQRMAELSAEQKLG